jgi:hypothetical protein
VPALVIAGAAKNAGFGREPAAVIGRRAGVAGLTPGRMALHHDGRARQSPAPTFRIKGPIVWVDQRVAAPPVRVTDSARPASLADRPR